MKLFMTMFELVKLPLVIVKDIITIPVDMSTGYGAFSDTKDQCETIDDLVSR